MKKIKVFIYCLILILNFVNCFDDSSSVSSSDSTSSTQPISYDGWNLIFQDEFDGDSLDTTIWNPISQSYDYNMELEDYIPENIIVENGYLILIAKKENYQNHNYTSGKLTSSGKFNTTFGRIESLIKLPYGQGMWPAFWMMPESNACWPSEGEIDIMESIGEDMIYGTFHYSKQCNQNIQNGGKIPIESFSNDFNLYSVIWDENEITWMVNNIPYFTMDTTTTLPVPSTIPFYLIFNLAVGGDWGGNPLPSFKFK